MIAVGVGSGIDYSELQEIADGKTENVIHVNKFEDLFVRLNTVLKASCKAWLRVGRLNYTKELPELNVSFENLITDIFHFYFFKLDYHASCQARKETKIKSYLDELFGLAHWISIKLCTFKGI